MTIEVRNTLNQSIDISTQKEKQIIEIMNAPLQEIAIEEGNGAQIIEIKNVNSQGIAVEQSVKIITLYTDAPEYEGEYEVTPKLVEQMLPTSNKLLKRDVKIEKIAITRVSNTSGGNTVIIGG